MAVYGDIEIEKGGVLAYINVRGSGVYCRPICPAPRANRNRIMSSTSGRWTMVHFIAMVIGR